ncbi:MAG: nucleotide exchange factor GrpE [bacterium]
MDERDDLPTGEGAEKPGTVSDATESAEELRAKVAHYKEEAERNWQQFLHAAADLENYKKQAVRQRDGAVQQVRTSLLNVILTVVDNLDRALEHADKDGRAESILEGIRMTHRQVTELLQSMGVRSIDTIGKPFDPRFHEAVDVASSGAHSVEPGTVVEELQKGYLFNGEVLRPARVRVAN